MDITSESVCAIFKPLIHSDDKIISISFSSNSFIIHSQYNGFDISSTINISKLKLSISIDDYNEILNLINLYEL